MPKYKKISKLSYYEGIGSHPDKAEIQKSRPLQTLSETDLTLPEFKILDAYLARINSHDPDRRTVRLEKGELEEALGISEIKQDDLKKRLRHLFQTVEIKDNSKRNGFKLINLFEEADAEQDNDGLWQITLTCTPSALEYVFNIDNLGYLRYRLKNVITLTSRYSYVLFLYLLDNRFRKTWNIDLADLKTLLNCNADTYKKYKYFNDLVLKKCHKELCEKTDIRFEYKPVKRGRAVTAVEFTVFSALDSLGADGGAVSSARLTDESDVDYGSELGNLLGNSACDNEFSPEEVRVLQDLVLNATHTYDRMEMCDYLIEKVHLMNLYHSKNPIKNRFSYLKQMIENDCKNSRS